MLPYFLVLNSFRLTYSLKWIFVASAHETKRTAFAHVRCVVHVQEIIRVFCPSSNLCTCCGATWHCLHRCHLQAVVYCPPTVIVGFVKRKSVINQLFYTSVFFRHRIEIVVQFFFNMWDVAAILCRMQSTCTCMYFCLGTAALCKILVY